MSVCAGNVLRSSFDDAIAENECLISSDIQAIKDASEVKRIVA